MTRKRKYRRTGAAQLAELLDVTPRQIQSWLRGRRPRRWVDGLKIMAHLAGIDKLDAAMLEAALDLDERNIK